MEKNPDHMKGEEFITRLYLQAFPLAAKFISAKGGSLEQARDIFQEALVIYYEQVITTNKVVNAKAYLLGISKNLWYQQHKQSTQQISFDDLGLDLLNEPKEEQISTTRLLAFLETSGRKCMELLKAFYYDQFNMTKLSTTFGFSSTRSATVQKYKCLEKVREEVKERKLSYEDFTE